VRYQYRNILTTAGSQPGTVKVYNENFFTDLSRYRMLWTLEADGKAVRSGVVDHLQVGPQECRAMVLGIGALPAGNLVTLTVRYQLKEADPLLPAGFEVAYDQLVLRDEPVLMGSSVSESGQVKAEETASAYTFSGTASYPGTLGCRQAVWTVTIDKSLGALTSYKLDGKELLSGPMVPCFDRALTENDLGAGFDKRFALWKNPSFRVASAEMKPVGNACQVDVVYAPIDGKARVKVAYLVDPEGRVAVSEAMEDAGGLADAPHLLRFGMRFAMPGQYSNLDFFGLGPWENYADRCSSALLGRYRQRVEDQYHYGYVRSQESGTHTGMRWMRLLDEAGDGLEFSASSAFSASALPFSLEDLDTHVHSLELKGKAFEGMRSRGTTYVHIDRAQMGVGGITSWGTWPLDEYLLPAKPYDFVFLLKPVFGAVE